ncbi:MAG TPA: hypothetical protein VLH19_04905 [Patescibacteria group bacterium]|nr:hypothetical protein [Patescibacteria group bacterium]
MGICNISDPSSAPYISGDTFRTLGNHIYDEHSHCRASDINAGDCVFVGLRKLDEFFTYIHPSIVNPYILISHNGDLDVDSKYKKYLNRKIIHWYTQNASFVHPKLTPIPIGLENLDYFNHGITTLYDDLRGSSRRKVPRILYGFSISTNPSRRSKVLKVLSQVSVSNKITERLNSMEYLKQLSRYMFVASPPGNGEDCIRTWEALYLGVIPIVESSVLTRSFVKLGLPLLIIEDWKVLEKYDEQSLEKLYKRMMKKADFSALYFRYWKSRIEKTHAN